MWSASAGNGKGHRIVNPVDLNASKVSEDTQCLSFISGVCTYLEGVNCPWVNPLSLLLDTLREELPRDAR